VVQVDRVGVGVHHKDTATDAGGQGGGGRDDDAAPADGTAVGGALDGALGIGCHE
jgi:hypothetical protein